MLNRVYAGSLCHLYVSVVQQLILCLSHDRLSGSDISIDYSMFCVGYGIYTREHSSRVYIS